MGIPGFTNYIKKRRRTLFQEKVRLRDSRLVFDGHALMYALVAKAPGLAYGGDYDTLYVLMKSFFERLRSLGVEVYVVCDGGNNMDLKPVSSIKSRKKFIQRVGKMNKDMNPTMSHLPLPLFLITLYKEVFVDVGVKHVTVDQEPDLPLACIANELNGYVVTNDTDLFLCHIQNGVITVNDLMSCLDCEYNGDPECLFYNRRHLARYLDLDETMLPCLALVLGNDYSVNDYQRRAETMCGVKDRRAIDQNVDIVASFMKMSLQFRKKDDDDVTLFLNRLCRTNDKMRSQFVKELQEYDVNLVYERCKYYQEILENPKSIVDILKERHSSTLNYVTQLMNNMLIKASVIDMAVYRTHLVSIQCEYNHRAASSIHSEKLRIHLYTLVCGAGGTFTEYSRKDSNFICTEIPITPTTPRSLLQLLEAPVEERREFMFHLLQLSTSQREKLLKMGSQSILFLLALRYFMNENDKIKMVDVEALLVTFTVCRTKGDYFEDSTFSTPPPMDLNVLHLYAGFRSVLHYTFILNRLLGDPLPPIEIKCLLSGSKLQRISGLMQKEKDFDIKMFLAYEEHIEDFENQLNFITSSISQEVQQRISSESANEKQTGDTRQASNERTQQHNQKVQKQVSSGDWRQASTSKQQQHSQEAQRQVSSGDWRQANTARTQYHSQEAQRPMSSGNWRQASTARTQRQNREFQRPMSSKSTNAKQTGDWRC